MSPAPTDRYKTSHTGKRRKKGTVAPEKYNPNPGGPQAASRWHAARRAQMKIHPFGSLILSRSRRAEPAQIISASACSAVNLQASCLRKDLIQPSKPQADDGTGLQEKKSNRIPSGIREEMSYVNLCCNFILSGRESFVYRQNRQNPSGGFVKPAGGIPSLTDIRTDRKFRKPPAAEPLLTGLHGSALCAVVIDAFGLLPFRRRCQRIGLGVVTDDRLLNLHQIKNLRRRSSREVHTSM